MRASVVIASYNHQRFAEECLRSVFDQTYEDVELILVDDASRDDTFEIAREFLARPDVRARFSRVECLRNASNQGAHVSWNRGLRRTRGDLIFLLNSDDLFDPTRVEEFVARAGDEPLFFGFSDVVPVDEDTVAYSHGSFAAQLRYMAPLAIQRWPYASWAFLEKQIAVSTGNFVFTPDLLRRVGGFAPLRYCHDWEFVLRCCAVTEPAYLPKDLYLYRLHDGNSFRSLGNVAERETRMCVKTYTDWTFSRSPDNRLCLCPANFGTLYEQVIDRFPTVFVIDELFAPYKAGHRTVSNPALLERRA